MENNQPWYKKIYNTVKNWVNRKNVKKLSEPIKTAAKTATVAGVATMAAMSGADKVNAQEHVFENGTDKKAVDVSSKISVNPFDSNKMEIKKEQLQEQADKRAGRSDIQKARDTAKTINVGLDGASDVVHSIERLNRSSGINSFIKNAEKLSDSIVKGNDIKNQILNTNKDKKVEKTEKEDKQEEVKENVTKKEEVTQKKDNITIKKDANKKTPVETTIEAEQTEQKQDVGGKYSVAHIQYDPDNKEFLSERLVDRYIARSLPAKSLTSGENIEKIAYARTKLKIYMVIAKKQNKMDIVDKIQEALIESDEPYNKLKEAALKNIGNPEYDLHVAKSYPIYAKYDNKQFTAKKVKASELKQKQVKQEIDAAKTVKSPEVKNSTQPGDFKEFGVLLKMAKENPNQTITITGDQLTANSKTTYKQPHNPVKVKQDIKIGKKQLSAIEAGQSGIYEDKPAKKVKKAKQKAPKVDYSKIADGTASVGQMGTNFEELDTLMDLAKKNPQMKSITLTADQLKKARQANQGKFSIEDDKKETVNKYVDRDDDER